MPAQSQSGIGAIWRAGERPGRKYTHYLGTGGHLFAPHHGQAFTFGEFRVEGGRPLLVAALSDPTKMASMALGLRPQRPWP
ncbi:MAG: hypothetical protein KDC23_08520 [Actinobacteria bacterium]|nr:hypothetical protein [Actinomycetota bacterium]